MAYSDFNSTAFAAYADPTGAVITNAPPPPPPPSSPDHPPFGLHYSSQEKEEMKRDRARLRLTPRRKVQPAQPVRKKVAVDPDYITSQADYEVPASHAEALDKPIVSGRKPSIRSLASVIETQQRLRELPCNQSGFRDNLETKALKVALGHPDLIAEALLEPPLKDDGAWTIWSPTRDKNSKTVGLFGRRFNFGRIEYDRIGACANPLRFSGDADPSKLIVMFGDEDWTGEILASMSGYNGVFATSLEQLGRIDTNIKEVVAFADHQRYGQIRHALRRILKPDVKVITIDDKFLAVASPRAASDASAESYLKADIAYMISRQPGGSTVTDKMSITTRRVRKAESAEEIDLKRNFLRGGAAIALKTPVATPIPATTSSDTATSLWLRHIEVLHANEMSEIAIISYPTSYTSISDGRIEMARIAKGISAAKQRGDKIYKIIKFPAGVGKTEALLDMIAGWNEDGHPLRLLYLVPNHRLARELKARAEAMGIVCLHFRGRTQRDLEEAIEALCVRWRELEAARKLGLKNETLTFCGADDDPPEKQCPHRKGCPHRLQLVGVDPSVTLIISVHQCIIGNGPGAIAKWIEIVIMDEACLRAMIGSHDALGRGAFVPHSEADLTQRHLDITNAIFDALRMSQPIYQALRGRRFAPNDLSGFAELLRMSETLPHAGMTTKEIAKKLDAIHPGRVAAANLLDDLADGMCNGLEHDWSLTLTADGEHIQRTILSPMHANWRDLSIVVIDADANERLVRATLGDHKWDFYEIHVQRNARIVQIDDMSLAGSTMKDDRLPAEIKLVIDRINHDPNKKMLTVMPKAVRQTLTDDKSWDWPENSGQLHFGYLRGIDLYKPYDIVAVFGRMQPSWYDLESQKQAIFKTPVKRIRKGSLDDLIKEPRVIKMRNGNVRVVDVLVHPDRDVQMLMEQSRECETLQAIDRLRLTSRSIPALVYLFSSLPIPGLIIDEFISWKVISGRLGKLGVALADTLSGGRAFPWTKTTLAKVKSKGEALFASSSAAASALNEADGELFERLNLHVRKTLSIYQVSYVPVEGGSQAKRRAAIVGLDMGNRTVVRAADKRRMMERISADIEPIIENMDRFKVEQIIRSGEDRVDQFSANHHADNTATAEVIQQEHRDDQGIEQQAIDANATQGAILSTYKDRPAALDAIRLNDKTIIIISPPSVRDSRLEPKVMADLKKSKILAGTEEGTSQEVLLALANNLESGLGQLTPAEQGFLAAMKAKFSPAPPVIVPPVKKPAPPPILSQGYVDPWFDDGYDGSRTFADIDSPTEVARIMAAIDFEPAWIDPADRKRMLMPPPAARIGLSHHEYAI